jgi:hypothetical protein
VPPVAFCIDAENGEREVHRRVHGLGVRPGALVYVEADAFDLRKDFAEVEALVAEHEPTVIVLDSLRSLAPGLDENDSQQAEAALRPVVRLTQATGKATLILHHAGKSGVEYRGSTAIGAAVELGFTLARHPEDPEGATRRRLACWKCRPAKEPPMRWISLGVNAGGRILLDEAEPFEPRAARQEERRSAVLDALSSEPQSERAVAAATDVPRATVQRILSELRTAELAERRPNGWVAQMGHPNGNGATP